MACTLTMRNNCLSRFKLINERTRRRYEWRRRRRGQFCLFLLIIKRGCYLIGLWRGNYGKKMKSLNRDSDWNTSRFQHLLTRTWLWRNRERFPAMRFKKKQLFFNLEWCRVLQGEKWEKKKELRSFHKLLLFRTSITHFYIPAVAQVWPPSTRLISPLGERSLEPEAPGSKLCAPIFSDKAGDVY